MEKLYEKGKEALQGGLNEDDILFSIDANQKYNKDSLNNLYDIYKNVQKYYEEAESSFDKLNKTLCKKIYKKLNFKKLNNNNIELYANTLHYLAIIYEKLGQYEKAETYYNTTISVVLFIKQSSPKKHFRKELKFYNDFGDFYFELKKFEKSLKLFKKLKILTIKNLNEYIKYAKFYRNLNRYQDFPKNIKKRLRGLIPNCFNAYFKCAEIYRKLGQYKKSSKEFNKFYGRWLSFIESEAFQINSNKEESFYIRQREEIVQKIEKIEKKIEKEKAFEAKWLKVFTKKKSKELETKIKKTRQIKGNKLFTKNKSNGKTIY